MIFEYFTLNKGEAAIDAALSPSLYAGYKEDKNQLKLLRLSSAFDLEEDNTSTAIFIDLFADFQTYYGSTRPNGCSEL